MSHDIRCRQLADYFLRFDAVEETRAALAEHIQCSVQAFLRENFNWPHYRGDQPPPDGYERLPKGVSCKCVKAWTNGEGVFWCCKGGPSLQSSNSQPQT